MNEKIETHQLFESPLSVPLCHCELDTTYCCWKKSCTSWYDKYPIIYRVSYISGGAGFLPSTVWYRCTTSINKNRTLPEATGSRCSMLGMYFRNCCLAKLGFGKGVPFWRPRKGVTWKHAWKTNAQVVGKSIAYVSKGKSKPRDVAFFRCFEATFIYEKDLKGNNGAPWAKYYQLV